MRSVRASVVTLACLVLAVGFGASRARAQALCGSGFGTSGLEICVTLDSGSGTPVLLRGTSPLPVGGVGGVPLIVGDYDVALVATFVATGSGIELNVAGVIQRVSDNDPPATALIIIAEAGRTSTLPGGAGFLSISGAADGTSLIVQGGAAGFPVLDDLQPVGFPATIQASTLGAGAFQVSDQVGSVNAGSVAIQSTTVVTINDPGVSVVIPTGVGGGDPVFPMGTGRQVTIEVEGFASGYPEHFPIEQFKRRPPDLCPGEHFHVRVAPLSLEGGTFFDNGECGAGEVDDVIHRTFALVESDLTLEEDYFIPDGEGVFIGDDASLTIASGITMTVAAASVLVNQGALNVDGFLLVEATAAIDNNSSGVINNAAETIHNFGTLNNRGTINNDGTIVNQPGGVVNDTGTLNGNPIEAPEPAAGLGSVAAFLTLCWLVKRKHKLRG